MSAHTYSNDPSQTQTCPTPLQTGHGLSESMVFGSRPVPLQKAHLTNFFPCLVFDLGMNFRYFNHIYGSRMTVALLFERKAAGRKPLSMSAGELVRSVAEVDLIRKLSPSGSV